MILKMVLKWFDFQYDLDFEITTSKMILILNHLYLGDLILILPSSVASIWQLYVACIFFLLIASWTHSSNISGWVLNKFHIKPHKSVWEQFCINHLTHIAWNDRYISKWSIEISIYESYDYKGCGAYNWYTSPVDSLCQTESLEEGTVLFTLSATDAPSTLTALLGSTRDAGEKNQHFWIARVFTKTGCWDCFAQKI